MDLVSVAVEVVEVEDGAVLVIVAAEVVVERLAVGVVLAQELSLPLRVRKPRFRPVRLLVVFLIMNICIIYMYPALELSMYAISCTRMY